MARALLTINFNGALCDNSRRSMQAACQRWGADFWEWNESSKSGYVPVAPNALKCWAFRRSAYDEVFILDADTLVSSSAPDPFELFSGPELIAVRNGSERFGDLSQVRSCECYEWEKLLAQEGRLAGAKYIEGSYWNTGMILARRKNHEAMFRLASEVALIDHGLGWVDQTPLNMAAIIAGVNVNLVSESWNYIHPYMLGAEWMDMTKFPDVYVYHGAGEPSRIVWLPNVKWS